MYRIFSRFSFAAVVLASIYVVAGCDGQDTYESPDRSPDEREVAEVRPSTATAHEAPAVARVHPRTGDIVVLEDRLNRSFADGGTIRRFEVAKGDGGYTLLRIGLDAKGACRTEAYPLTAKGLDLIPDFEVKWITFCFSTDCTLGSGEPGHEDFMGFCDLDTRTNTCSCIGEGSCSPHVDHIEGLYDILYIW